MRFACLILPITLLAQAPPEGLSVHDLLASSDSAQLAWGAELAARSGQVEYVPELRRLLAWTDDRVTEQALDALIRLKAKVPPEELAALPAEFKPQVIILAVTNGNRDLLLSLLARNPRNDATWVALNEGLLAGGAGPAYWPALLRDWTIHVTIYVTDQARTAPPRLAQGGGMCGDSLALDRLGFPPRAVYGLFLDPIPRDLVLVSRPHPVYYRRHLSPSGCDIRIDRDDYRGDFIAPVAHVNPLVKGHIGYDIAWPNDEGYVAEMDNLRRDFLDRYQQILDALLKRRLLAAQDGALKPRVDLDIQDQRASQSRPLPATPPWE